MLKATVLIVLVAGSYALPFGTGVEDANAYIDSIINFEMPERMYHLDPLTSSNFQPVNANNRDVKVRFVSTRVTGLRDIRRDGDCQLTPSVDDQPRKLECVLRTDLHYSVVVNATNGNVALHDVSVSGSFENVTGPLIFTFQGLFPKKAEFQARFDAMTHRTRLEVAHAEWYKFFHSEYYRVMIYLFEYATKRVYASEFLRASKDIPFPE